MKNYLSMNTMYLTNKGFKYIHELTNEDSLIYKKLVGNIGITNNFSTKIDKIDRVYDNFDSKYSRLVSNFMSCPKSVTSLTKPNNDFKISKFYLKCHNKEELWYTDISFDNVLCLSLVISNFFIQDKDGYVVRNFAFSDKAIYEIFKAFNDYLNIYFPYSKSLKSYNFKTNLFLEYDSIELKLIENIEHSKQIVELLLKYHIFRGFDYKSMLLTRYSLACILQVYFNLNGYDTKIEKEGNLFRLTVINSSEVTFTHRDTSTKLDSSFMGNVTIDDDGYLIVSQCNNGITNVSFVESI